MNTRCVLQSFARVHLTALLTLVPKYDLMCHNKFVKASYGTFDWAISQTLVIGRLRYLSYNSQLLADIAIFTCFVYVTNRGWKIRFLTSSNELTSSFAR